MKDAYENYQELNVEVINNVIQKLGIIRYERNFNEDGSFRFRALIHGKLDLNIMSKGSNITIISRLLINANPASFPLIALKLAKEYKNKLYASPRFDTDDGEITVEYSFENTSTDGESYEKLSDALETYMISAIVPTLAMYDDLDDMSHGILYDHEKESFIGLLEHTIALLKGARAKDYEWDYPEGKAPETVPDELSMLIEDEDDDYNYPIGFDAEP